MNLFCPSYKLIYLTLSSAMLVACSTVVTPVQQIHQVQKEKESVKKVTKLIAQAPKVSLYRCENDKKVEVERQGRTKKALKKEIVTVSYQGTTH